MKGVSNGANEHEKYHMWKLFTLSTANEKESVRESELNDSSTANMLPGPSRAKRFSLTTQ